MKRVGEGNKRKKSPLVDIRKRRKKKRKKVVARINMETWERKMDTLHSFVCTLQRDDSCIAV